MRKLIIFLLLASAFGHVQKIFDKVTSAQINSTFYVGPQYPTVQACLTASGVGGTCVVPNSITATGSSILITPANQTLRCNPGVVITRGFNSDLINITGAEATVDGCILDGNQPTNTGNSVIICQAAKCRITNNTVRSSSNIGIYVAARSGQVPGAIITHNRVYGNLGIGIFAEKGASGALISLNKVDTTGATVSGAHGIALHSTAVGQNVSKSAISNNTIYNGGANGFCVEVGAFAGDSPDSNIISNNYCKATAATVAGGYSMGQSDNLIVSGNTFNNNGLTLLLANLIAGIEVVGGAAGCTIKGNTVVLGAPTGGQGIIIDRASKCSVTGNVIDGWGPFSARAAGIKVSTVVGRSNLNDNLLTGNTLTCPVSGSCAGIWIQCNNASANCNRNHVTGNHVFGNAVAGSFCYKTELDAGTMVSNVVVNNSGDSCDTGLSITGAQTLACSSNNVFSNTPTKFTSTVINTVMPQWKRLAHACCPEVGLGKWILTKSRFVHSGAGNLHWIKTPPGLSQKPLIGMLG